MKGEWQPIETAPKDRDIILYRPGVKGWFQVSVGRFDADVYAKRPTPYWATRDRIVAVREAREATPTHWMPLPEPPA